MYKIFLKRKTKNGFEIDFSTYTKIHSPAVAEKAFRKLISRSDLKGQEVIAYLVLNTRILMTHKFYLSPRLRGYVDAEDEIILFL